MFEFIALSCLRRLCGVFLFFSQGGEIHEPPTMFKVDLFVHYT